jgi:FtsH-binding integral membrane protein
MQRFDENTLQALGFALIVLGFLLIIIALLGGFGISSCPANGCPPSTFQWVGIFTFSSGIALVIIGIILLIVAREMKPDQETAAFNRSEETV